jgi:hypothetical protein
VTVAIHVVLRESENLQGLYEELLLCEGVANELKVICGVLVRGEIGRGLSDGKGRQYFIKLALEISAVQVLEVLLVLYLVFEGFSQVLLLLKQVFLELNTLSNNVALHSLFSESSKFL